MRIRLAFAAIGLTLVSSCGDSSDPESQGGQSNDLKVIAYSDLPENVQQAKRPNCDAVGTEIDGWQSTLEELIDALDAADASGSGGNVRQGIKTATGWVAMLTAANPDCFEASEVSDSYAVLHLTQ